MTDNSNTSTSALNTNNGPAIYGSSPTTEITSASFNSNVSAYFNDLAKLSEKYTGVPVEQKEIDNAVAENNKKVAERKAQQQKGKASGNKIKMAPTELSKDFNAYLWENNNYNYRPLKGISVQGNPFAVDPNSFCGKLAARIADPEKKQAFLTEANQLREQYNNQIRARNDFVDSIQKRPVSLPINRAEAEQFGLNSMSRKDGKGQTMKEQFDHNNKFSLHEHSGPEGARLTIAGPMAGKENNQTMESEVKPQDVAEQVAAVVSAYDQNFASDPNQTIVDIKGFSAEVQKGLVSAFEEKGVQMSEKLTGKPAESVSSQNSLSPK